jgi:nickel/cobalt exporter
MPSLARLRPARLLPLRAALVALAALAALGAWPQAASAHPLGNFTVNRYSRLEPGAGSIALLYVVDMAEIPTFQTRQAIDTDHDDRLTAPRPAAGEISSVPAWPPACRPRWTAGRSG